ncbi:MAG: hypothetical protein IT371_08105 [Deltaproteobacteria bacterium]|nr:hypothetical protein [Deltaproteobacteria bacterium]
MRVGKEHAATKWGTYVGSGLGLVAFLLLGAVPALLFGGYAGLMMAHLIVGAGPEPSILARVLTGGGMLLGLAAVGFLFLVAGAFLGTVVGYGVDAVASWGTSMAADKARSPSK